MGISNFYRNVIAIFRLSHKSDRHEFSLYLRLVLLGVGVVGAIGFFIKLVGNLFFG